MKKKIDIDAEIKVILDQTKVALEEKFKCQTGQVFEVAGGLEALLNKKVLLLCAGYFYEGILRGVNHFSVELEDASVVFNPESLSIAKINTCTRDKLPCKKWDVTRQSIESFGELA